MREKVDAVLINPGSRSQVYQGLGDEFSAIEPPSLAALFATYLRRRGQTVMIIDAPANAYSAEDVAKIVCEDFDPVLVVLVVYGFQPSASTQNMPAAGAIAKAIKEDRPEIKVMMTGTHPAALPARTMQDEKVDFVCSSEGPRTITQTILYLKAGRESFSEIAGLHYRAHGLVCHTPPGELMSEDALNQEMPGAAWDLLPMHAYRAHNWHCLENIAHRSPYASIHTSLGCPYRCSFCCINAPFGGSSYRMWSPLNVGNELELLADKYGVRNVKFVDEMFVLNRAHVHGVCDELIERGLGQHMNIWAYARVDTVKDEFLEKLRKAGFRWLALGIESASKHVRDGVDKGRFQSEEILKTVRKIQAAGINVLGNFIFGLPDDTEDSMRDTLLLALEARCQFVNFYSGMAYPGSKLYTDTVARGGRLPAAWSGYSQHAYDTTPMETETMTSEQVLAFRDYAFQRYFGDPDVLARMLRQFGEAAVNNVANMRLQELPRNLLQTA